MHSSTAIVADLALRHGGVRAAARAAGLPVASVSTALARLEAALGTPLARRSEDGLALTIASGGQAAAIARVARLARQVHGIAVAGNEPITGIDPQGAGEGGPGGQGPTHSGGAGPDTPPRSTSADGVPARPVSFAALFRLGQVLRAGSIRRAALQMQLAQPQLTRQVAQLEASLGTALVVRGRAGITPTPAGERLARVIDLLEAEWSALTGAAEAPHRQASRRFALGAVVPASPDGQVAALLGRIVGTVAMRQAMSLTVSAAIAEDLLAGLDSGRFDAVIVDSQQVGASCQQRRLLTTGAVLVGPGLPPRTDDRAALRAALSASPLVLQSARAGLRQCAEGFLDRAAGPDWRRFTRLVEVDSLPVILHMARAGAALTVLPRALVAREFHGIPVLGLPADCDLGYWLTWRDRPKGRRLALAIEAALADGG